MENAILPFKINELVSLICEKKKLDITDAMSYLYASEFYKKLLDEKSKWWYLSGLNLYRVLEKEKKQQQQGDSQLVKEKLFFIFCAENYRKLKLMEATEVHSLFQKYDVYNFLIQNYDVLHSQGEDYILHEIEIYIKNRKLK
jgi:hypothetical protein